MTSALRTAICRAENRANDLESAIFRALLHMCCGKVWQARLILERAAPNLADELGPDPAGPSGGRAA